MMRARLQRAIKGRTACSFTCGGDGVNFGVRTAVLLVPPFADESPLVIDDHCPHGRVGFDCADPALSELDGVPHD